jgi:hypothetical protein
MSSLNTDENIEAENLTRNAQLSILFKNNHCQSGKEKGCYLHLELAAGDLQLLRCNSPRPRKLCLL